MTPADTPKPVWTRKDLIALEDLSRGEIEMILDTAPQFVAVSKRESGIKKVPLLQGRLVVNWFFEPSTRTRTSFELAAKRLSADTLAMNVQSSSSKKGESLHDTLDNIEAMHSDLVVIRHSYAGSAHILAERHESHIINAGDGAHEHPTQGLLDAYTIRDHIRKHRNDPNATIDGIRVAIIGDAAHGMAPNLGQGAGVAIVNGVVLAKLLAKNNDVPGVLRRWEAAERPYVDKTQRMSFLYGAVGTRWPRSLLGLRGKVLPLLSRADLWQRSLRVALDHKPAA